MSSKSARFTRPPRASADTAEVANPAVMSEADFRAFQRRKADAKASADVERKRAEEAQAQRERENRARAAAATKSQQLLKQQIEATKAYELRMEAEAEERKKQREVERAVQEAEEKKAKKEEERRAAIELELRQAEEAIASRVAAERDMKLDARRNRSINTAMGDSQRANKAAADIEAEVRAWEQALETGRAVVYCKLDGAKYAYNPVTRATFWLRGTRLDDLPAAPESEAATGALLMDEGKLRQQINRVRQRSLALEMRTAEFLRDVGAAPLDTQPPATWVEIGRVS